jgi:hypothetical protein
MPSENMKKGRFLKYLRNHPVELGIINHTAQYPSSRSDA